ncbi:hypothetical protein CIB95_14910 [Lottiidibacillus patelloidae]|uniref:Uncharacterized protein n=1 Tax=Lottiidibacillus patelloidae TaxID=2670334 RepID=A0A263BQF6_9BACI|nr:hypothetical protein [Lottiidibacillus patelloidae]OZM55950.1 hypothetical protein CIB95_14910 [Lottiidibacillus patelloidae]
MVNGKSESSNPYVIKGIMVVVGYLIVLLIISLVASVEMGSMEQGFIIVLYGFYSFVEFLFSLKDGFPISINNPTDNVFWLYVLVGMTLYIVTIFISHYYLFQKSKNRGILLVTVNLLIIASYIFFEASIIGFATV